MTKTEEIRQTLEREVATLHQTIGGLMVRIESLEKQKSCAIKKAIADNQRVDSLRDELVTKLQESGLTA